MKSRKKTKAAYDKQKNSFVGRQIPKILTNVLCVIMIPAMIHFIPIGLHRVSEYTGYGQDNYAYETEEEAEEEDMQTGETMVITADSANIRSGPGTDYEVIATAGKGDVFVATGNQETADNGRIWYEVLCTYGEDGTLQPGWASEKVIDFEQ